MNRAAKAERDIGTWSAGDATVHWWPGSRWMSETARPICGSCSAASQPDRAAGSLSSQARSACTTSTSDEELVAVLTGHAGFSPDFAALFVEFNETLSEGRLHSLEGRNEGSTTPTEFEEFAVELTGAYAATG